MAKKKNTFSKLLAFTTAAAAIGGTCYVFRDKIKSCPLYQKMTDSLSDLKNNVSDKFCKDDDFIFDDEDDFEDDFKDVFTDTEHGREYTSITINAKEESFSKESSLSDDAFTDNINTDTVKTDSTENSNTDTVKTDFADSDKASAEPELEEVIPTICFGSPLNPSQTVSKEKEDETTNGYENAGLSDVSEDPDTLEEQDKLDF